jgi:amidophosphoribosyltransferase
MCGIVGIYKSNGKDVSADIYDGLIQVQHRGQDASGISTWNNSKMFMHKELGLVSEVFKKENLLKLTGNIGIGHVRYPTAGCDDVIESQPFYSANPVSISLAHNGTLINSNKVRSQLIKTRFCQFNTESDSEVLLNLFAYELSKIQYRKLSKSHIFKALESVYRSISGGFAVVMIVAGIGIIAFRDRHGIRPVVLGKKDSSYMFASESSALTALDYQFLQDVKPGQAIIIDEDGRLSQKQVAEKIDHSPCLFEYVYFSRPDSTIDSISVHKSRLRMGDYLGEKIVNEYQSLKIDVVIPIPDTSRTSAMQVAHKVGAKYREGFMKNRYIGRTFIMPGQSARKKSVAQKLNPIEIEFKGKNVLLVDDSIVRGHTSKKIIQMVRKCGAKKVYFASASPPVRFQNVYGIDMPATEELIANNKSIKEIRKYIGADELIYQELEDLKRSAHTGNPSIKKFEDSVFSGNYCTGDITQKYLNSLENSRSDSKRTG